jgi:DNA-binding response OmpR family regulator
VTPTYEILLVEDNPDHAELVMRSLESHQLACKIHHLADGEAALDYLFRRGAFADVEASPRPHVVLLDLGLPKISGLDVLKEVRSAHQLDDMPIVVLTTSKAETDVEDAYKLHANSYLVKPHDFAAFTELMSALGSYWLGWNQLPGSACKQTWV